MVNPYFNAQYYLTRNPDLYAAGVRTAEQAEAHYLTYGAAENLANSATRSGPNPWFDAQYYISSNLDLQRAGLTVKDALAHYAAYGVTEGRAPSATAVAGFTPGDYATNNADVALAVGMSSATATPTAAQANLLLGHYLAYGYVEGRPNSGLTFVTDITAAGVKYGSFANDTFAWNGSTAAYLVGLGGTDTVKLTATTDHAITLESVENIVVTTAPIIATTAKLSVAGTGVSSVSVTNSGVGSFTYSGAKVDSFTLGAAGAVAAEFTTGTTGSADALGVNVAATAATAAGSANFAVKGIETVNVNLASTATVVASGLNLNADAVQGSALAVNVTGGKSDGVTNNTTLDAFVTLESLGSTALTTVTLNGSAAVGDQELTVGASLARVNATVTGGVGDDVLITSTAKGHTATLSGGAGVDTLNASLGQDSLTGGAGNDIFVFAAAANGSAVLGTDGKISAVDTIADFTAGDHVTVTGMTLAAGLNAAIGTISAGGVLTFGTGFLPGKTLSDIVTALSADVGITANEGLVFNFDGQAYAFAAGATAGSIADDAVIKLTGVDATKLVVTAGDIAFAA